MSGSKLDTGKKYICEIFADKYFFNIPDYQRPYVWGDEQVSALLSDLYNAYSNNSGKEYFIGCMIWNEKSSREGENFSSYDILDGQQRFLTIYLLHSVFRDLSNNESLKSEVDRRLREEGNVFNGVPCRDRIDFDVRDDDKFLDKFIIQRNGTLEKRNLAEISSNGATVSTQNLANAVLVMHKWFEQLHKQIGVEVFQQELFKFFTFFSSKVLALYLATPDSLDDAYNLFTVLNSRGMQLQVSDILRANNLRAIKNDEMKILYAEEWDNYINKVRKPFQSFDKFLFSIIYIIMKYQSGDNKDLQIAFDHIERQGKIKKGEQTFELIGKYVEHYEEITSGNLDLGKDTCLFNNILFLQNTFCGSEHLMLLMQYKEFFGCNGIVEYLTKIDNIISLGWLLGVGSGTMMTRYFILMRKIEEFGIEYQRDREQFWVEKALNCEELKLNYETEQAKVYLNTNEFFSMLNNEKWGSYGGTKINKSKYLLVKLDLLHSGYTEKLSFDKNKSCVENIMPVNAGRSDLKLAHEQDEKWMHKLGNIVLLDTTKSTAKKMEKYDFTMKRDGYKKFINNREHSKTVFKNHDQWDLDSIAHNHEKIINLISSYYKMNTLEFYK